MKIINLGGHGGCVLTEIIKKLLPNQLRYPFDWLMTNQSFVINSFMDFNKSFDFDRLDLAVNNSLYSPDKHGLSIHDYVGNYINHKEIIKQRYQRRYKRLEEAMNESDDIIFIRESRMWKDWGTHPIMKAEKEDFHKWVLFMDNLQKIKPNIKLIIFTNGYECIDNYFGDTPNVKLFIKDFANHSLNYDIQIIDALTKSGYNILTNPNQSISNISLTN